MTKPPGILRTKRGVFFRNAAGRDTKALHAEGTPEFWAQYAAHRNGTDQSRAAQPAAHLDRKVSAKLSLGGLIARYFESDHFTKLGKGNRHQRRAYLETICQSVDRAGGKRRADYDADSFSTPNLYAIHKDYPGSLLTKDAAIKSLGVAYAHAKRVGLVNANPVPGFEYQGTVKGRPAWTDKQVAAFEARWPVGTEARLAFAFARYAMLRRSDIRQMGPAVFASPGRMIWTEAKNGSSTMPGKKAPKPKHRDIPQHPELMKVVARYRWTNRPYYIGGRADPSAMINHDSFGRLWKEWLTAAGLPTTLGVHGVRKWCARRLLASGECTKADIQKMGGWSKMDMVDLYTKGIDEEPMIRRAQAVL